jgi:hypothetical protein
MPLYPLQRPCFAFACIRYTERLTKGDSWCYSSRLLRVVRGRGIDVSCNTKGGHLWPPPLCRYLRASLVVGVTSVYSG